MKKIIHIQVHEKDYPNPHGIYSIQVDGHKLDVDQKCVDRINDLVEGKWGVEFDGGTITLYGDYPRSKPPKVCERCGKRISYFRDWCDDCLQILVDQIDNTVFG